jgi:hypothetical protein
MARASLLVAHNVDVDALGSIAITFEVPWWYFGMRRFNTKVCEVTGDRNGNPKLSDFPRLFDGIFVVDVSIGVGGRLHWTQYVAELMYVLWLKSGLYCAVIRADAYLKRGLLPEPLALSWLRSLLVKHFHDTGFIVWMCMDSHLEPLTYEYPPEQLARQCSSLFEFVRPYVQRQCMVYGGGSRIRRHEGAQMAHADAYDEGVSKVVKHFRALNDYAYHDVGIMIGEALLGDVVFNNSGMYGVCSVHHDQLEDVIKAFVVLVKWGLGPWPVGHAGPAGNGRVIGIPRGSSRARL